MRVVSSFPVCAATTIATVEKRYDAFMDFVSIVTGTNVRIYLPFLIIPVNPSTVGQTVIFTANVAPSTATGTVTFLDGTTAIGSGMLSGGKATLSTSGLSPRIHSITASYSGDANNLMKKFASGLDEA